ncbi:chorion class B protein PC10-like isoform X2 [Pararge aegeria]|uniref:chorion class B protein PC10-like isoform X2 n=1 Tax=Pararge aegeria TaxID=116150 RepID=UPI0019D047BB|nr:chorion class B protein PC10-like isoform X2 [Pararge aegeria]
MYKLTLTVCALALIQSISAQYIGAYNGLDIAGGYGWAGAVAPWAASCETIAPIGICESAWTVPFGNGFGPAALAASNGRGLTVTSASPIAPTGVYMTSENAYEGPLSVTGAIPFLGAVALEGALPTVGGGAVTYGCGNGNVAMISEDLAAGFGYSGLAYDGLAGPYGYPGAYGRPGGYGQPGYSACTGPWY